MTAQRRQANRFIATPFQVDPVCGPPGPPGVAQPVAESSLGPGRAVRGNVPRCGLVVVVIAASSTLSIDRILGKLRIKTLSPFVGIFAFSVFPLHPAKSAQIFSFSQVSTHPLAM